MSRDSASGELSGQVVSLSLFRFGALTDRLWALLQMGAARWPLSRMEDIGFFKLMGAGTGEGFTPVPDTSVAAVLSTWPSLDVARARIDSAPVFARYRARARDHLTLHLGVTSARGAWSGEAPFRAGFPLPDGPVAALTRATLKPHILLRFWGKAARVSQVIGRNDDVLFKIGLGEVPWLHQVTFSIWPDTTAMAAFARKDGPHADAIRAVRDNGWFREELYARFTVLDHVGHWPGQTAYPSALPLAAE